MKLRPKSLSNCLDQMSSKNYQSPFAFTIKNHQEHPQIGNRIEAIADNCRQRIEAIADKQCKSGCIYIYIYIYIYTKLSLKILLFRVQIKSHMIHFQISKVTY